MVMAEGRVERLLMMRRVETVVRETVYYCYHTGGKKVDGGLQCVVQSGEAGGLQLWFDDTRW
jgi:hypothetical protein